MYTNEDYENYINQILGIEIKMEDNIKELITYISDKDIIKSLNIILKDENNHKDYLKKIKIILKE